MAVNRFIPEEAVELSPEGKSLVNDVRSQMNDWIDESITQLTKEMGDIVKETGDKLCQHVDQVAQEFGEARRSMDQLLATIESLAENLEAGDGETIADAVKLTRDQVNIVRTELTAREERWQNLGKGIVNTGLKAASTIIKIPFLS